MSLYCKAPWTSLFVHSNGDVKCCCGGKWSWGNLHSQTIEETINNPKVIQLRQDILNNVANPYCSNCVESEKLSGDSQRSYFHKFDPNSTQLTDFDLHTMDIRWSNLCNLACAYCSEDWSTSWQKIKNIPISSPKANYHQNLLDYITTNNKNVKSIIVAGGEPLLHRQNEKLFVSLDETVEINVITNLSFKLDSSPIYSILKDRKNVNWSISMDNVGEQFEYVRHKANWAIMESNLLQLKETMSPKIMIFPVYCIYSMTELFELYNFVKPHNFNVYWQQLVGPFMLNVSHFSLPVRRYAADIISDLLDSELLPSVKLGNGINFLNETKKQLLGETKTVDIIQDKSFRDWIDLYENKFAIGSKQFKDLWPKLNEKINVI